MDDCKQTKENKYLRFNILMILTFVLFAIRLLLFNKTIEVSLQFFLSNGKASGDRFNNFKLKNVIKFRKWKHFFGVGKLKTALPRSSTEDP